MQESRCTRIQRFTRSVDGGDRQNLGASLGCELTTQPEPRTSGDEEIDDDEVRRSFLEQKFCLTGIKGHTYVETLCSEEVLGKVRGVGISLREEDQWMERRARFPYRCRQPAALELLGQETMGVSRADTDFHLGFDEAQLFDLVARVHAL